MTVTIDSNFIECARCQSDSDLCYICVHNKALIELLRNEIEQAYLDGRKFQRRYDSEMHHDYEDDDLGWD